VVRRERLPVPAREQGQRHRGESVDQRDDPHVSMTARVFDANPSSG
jgi:hypothetical protein